MIKNERASITRSTSIYSLLTYKINYHLIHKRPSNQIKLCLIPMSKTNNPSSGRSTRRSALVSSKPETDILSLPKTVRFTIDNEDIHDIVLSLENVAENSDKSCT